MSIPIDLATVVADMGFTECEVRRDEIAARIEEIAIDEYTPRKKAKKGVKPSPDTPLIVPKIDTHWDFMMKEMMWLSADFSAERKRQLTSGKKVSNGIRIYHKTRETKRVRDLADAELKRRRLGAKIGREVKGWWTKIERVIAYKQKMDAENARNKAMNQQLVALVKQTERYGETLASKSDTDDVDRISIEEALARADRRKHRQKDYSRLDIPDNDELYGEFTSADSGSDESFVVHSDSADDETTMKEAEDEEIRERKRKHNSRHNTNTEDTQDSFEADREELSKLQEEAEMDIDDILERLRCEGNPDGVAAAQALDAEPDRPKKVKFGNAIAIPHSSVASATAALLPASPSTKVDPGDEADDDESRNNDDVSDGSDEFQADGNEVDDETTIAAEERLGREMSVEAEISLLQNEATMPIEELRKMYATISETSANGPTEEGSEDDRKPAAKPATVEGMDTDNVKTRPSKIEEKGGDGGFVEAAGAGAAASHLDGIFNVNDEDDEDDFRPQIEVDDETTIAAEERMGREMDPAQEISLLQRESEIPIEQLRAMYATMNEHTDEVPSERTSTELPVPTAKSSLADLIQNAEDDNVDYEPDGDNIEVDDETTIAVEESLGRDMSYEEEIAILNRENEMSLEDLRAMYAGIDDARNEGADEESSLVETSDGDNDGSEGEEEFEPVEEAVDDETTIEVEERLGRDMSYEDEIEMLKRENEMSVEELRALYEQAEKENSVDNHVHRITPTEKGESAKGKNLQQMDSNRTKRRKLNSDDGDDEGLQAMKALKESEERARSTSASRPFLLSNWVKLRAYQQIGLNWLVSIQTRRLNGILADEMGLGKTLQTISLLSYLASYKGVWGPHLIIVPTSCIVNWETEIKRFCPAMKVLCYYGTAKRRKELRTGWTKSNWYHIIVTSYQLVVQDAFAFKRKKWYYMILDEAHNIKNFQSQRWQTLISFNTQRRLLLTGTPLQNNLTELWSLLHFLMPHVFRSRKEFSYWFSNPMNSIIEGNSKRSEDLIGRLHAIIRPFILRRLKRDVEQQMPGKYEHIVKCQMSRRQMFLYEEFMARSSTRQALKKGGNFMGMMNVLMQLRKVCNHPDLFEPRAVITPFAMDAIHYAIPSQVQLKTLGDEHSRLSGHVLTPLWCGDTGQPDLSRCLEVDQLYVDCLAQVKTKDISFDEAIEKVEVDEPSPSENLEAGLSSHLDRIWLSQKESRQQTLRGHQLISDRRCRVLPFLYPRQLTGLVTIDPPHLRGQSDEVLGGTVISTPRELLAMRKSFQARADDMNEVIKKFVFCIPKAGSKAPRLDTSLIDQESESFKKCIGDVLLQPIEEYLQPFKTSQARLSSFFPDKKLVQYDAGKLQTLSSLLHSLKRGGHRVLIFTQMSKMLDVFEAFLNLNGHTYLRLDGSTGVERRQRLMDRFNNDDKVFCFILSTRSGGLGINLTGADTVIFYDSDWNPAMDAQAQDRAHRIGQTRDVHIYRLITEHSIEENIWVKAKQKRNLDLIVMDEGKFDAAEQSKSHPAVTEKKRDGLEDMYSKGGILDILGVGDDGNEGDRSAPVQTKHMTKEQMEMAMASLEDEDDALALRGAQKEVEDELKEFDETIEYKKDDDATGSDDGAEAGNGTTKKTDSSDNEEKTDQNKDKDPEKKAEEDMVEEFNTWQSKVGMDASAIESSLSKTEQYALHFREEVEPFWSIFAIMEERRRLEAEGDGDEEVDIDELEEMKLNEERMALETGDLLGTHPMPKDLPRHRDSYYREKSRLRADKKRRKLTGENWVTRIDGNLKINFFYNEDTGEAVWEKPKVLLELEAEKLAVEKRWNAVPVNLLVKIFGYMVSYPERTTCALVCRSWRVSARDISFVRHVFPVEMSSFTRPGRKLEKNHYRTIAEAVEHSYPGDTIELGDGHYWINDPGLDVKFPLKFVGDEHDPSHVVIELSGIVSWKAKGGFFEGITFRRPKIMPKGSTSVTLSLAKGARLDMFHCVMDNTGSDGHVANIVGAYCHWRKTEIIGSGQGCGILAQDGCVLQLENCAVLRNRQHGVKAQGSSSIKLRSCRLESNFGTCVSLQSSSKVEIVKCRFNHNFGGLLEKEHGCSSVPCTGNTAVLPKGLSLKNIPGFRIFRDGESSNRHITPLSVKSL